MICLFQQHSCHDYFSQERLRRGGKERQGGDGVMVWGFQGVGDAGWASIDYSHEK